MGMGEPFHNYDAVMEAVALLNDPEGFGLGHRHITISTVGLVDKIDRFAGEQLQVNLAISLHAPDRRASLAAHAGQPSISARGAHGAHASGTCSKTNRKVFFEYVMLAGVNDDDACARELGKLMRGHLYHVNLIPYNSTPDGPFAATSERADSAVRCDPRRCGRSGNGAPEHGARYCRRLWPAPGGDAAKGSPHRMSLARGGLIDESM